VVCSAAARQWLQIISVKGIGAARWVALSRSVRPEEIVSMLSSEVERERLSRRFGRLVGAPDPAFVDSQLERLERGGYSLAAIPDELYPALLREIADPPPLLFVAGDLAALSRACVCIVGSRRATRRGALTARSLARELSARGVHVVSGLARGIDGSAHAGALEGAGGTSAVLGCGVDVRYPPEHGPLAREIARRGCVVSEFPLGVSPLKHHFPRRNRILSGVSLAVVVVEADLTSGAMRTAQWACDQNREVLAVPGPVDCPGSRGPHRLIRDGATLVEGVEDVLAALPDASRLGGSCGPAAPGLRGEPLCDEERAVLSALDLEPKHIDELVRFCHISPAAILPLLLDLEMRGLIESCGGGAYALAPPKR
jgi:DNA processing protein